MALLPWAWGEKKGMTRLDESKAKRDFSLRRPTLHWSEGEEKIGLLRSK
jgi:hypothetical protein